jgi:hypothetical protein
MIIHQLTGWSPAPRPVFRNLDMGAMQYRETVEAAQSGVYGLVVLCADSIDMPRLPLGTLGVHLKLKDRLEIPRAAWPPILDTVKMVRDAVRADQRVLVACAMGYNRSGLVTGLSLRALGVRPGSAVELIRSARGPYALNNKVFQEAVERWDGKLPA